MATLLDVFQAAGRTASPFLQHETERLKERNDLELQTAAANFAADMQQYVRNNPYNGNFDEYQKNLADFTNEQYNTIAGSNTSRYFQDQVKRMRDQSVLAAQS